MFIIYKCKCKEKLSHDKLTVVKQASAKLLLVPMPMAKGAWQSIVVGLNQSSGRLLVATFHGFLFPYFTEQSPFDCWLFMMFMMLSWGNGRLNTQHNRVNLRLASV